MRAEVLLLRKFIRCYLTLLMSFGVLETSMNRTGIVSSLRRCGCYRIFLRTTSLQDGCALGVSTSLSSDYVDVGTLNMF